MRRVEIIFECHLYSTQLIKHTQTYEDCNWCKRYLNMTFLLHSKYTWSPLWISNSYWCLVKYSLCFRTIYNTQVGTGEKGNVFVWNLAKHIATLNPLHAELNPICHLLALLRAHPFLHISRIRVKYQGLIYAYRETLYTVNFII